MDTWFINITKLLKTSTPLLGYINNLECFIPFTSPPPTYIIIVLDFNSMLFLTQLPVSFAVLYKWYSLTCLHTLTTALYSSCIPVFPSRIIFLLPEIHSLEFSLVMNCCWQKSVLECLKNVFFYSYTEKVFPLGMEFQVVVNLFHNNRVSKLFL